MTEEKNEKPNAQTHNKREYLATHRNSTEDWKMSSLEMREN